MVKKHTLFKTAENSLQHGKHRADRCSRNINRLFQFDYKYISKICTAGLNRRLHVKSSNLTTSKYTQSSIGDKLHGSEQSEDEDKDTDPVRGNLLQDLLEWLEDFTEILVDEGVSASKDTPASISRESYQEPPRKVVSGKHPVFTHFPSEGPKCEICQRTKITWSPCRKRTGNSVPGAETFGDLIKADHKVLSEECESRNNHRYAIVVQDLATQWIQSYPCKIKTSQETQRSLQKFLEPNRTPKVIYTDNSLEFGKACEDLSRNHCTPTPQIRNKRDC